jgi:hypothetical protein
MPRTPDNAISTHIKNNLIFFSSTLRGTQSLNVIIPTLDVSILGWRMSYQQIIHKLYWITLCPVGKDNFKMTAVVSIYLGQTPAWNSTQWFLPSGFSPDCCISLPVHYVLFPYLVYNTTFSQYLPNPAEVFLFHFVNTEKIDWNRWLNMPWHTV